MKNFAAEIRNHISEKFREKSFCCLDFLDITTKFGKNPKAATHVLRDMKAKQWLVDAAGMKKGVRDRTKFYRVVHGAVFDVVHSKSSKSTREQWEREKTEKERHASECARRLGAALDRMGI